MNRYFGSKPCLGEVKTSIDNTTGQHCLFLDLHFFWTQILKFRLVFVVPLFAKYFCVHENIFCKSLILFRFAFSVFHNNIFDLRITFLTCF